MEKAAWFTALATVIAALITAAINLLNGKRQDKIDRTEQEVKELNDSVKKLKESNRKSLEYVIFLLAKEEFYINMLKQKGVRGATMGIRRKASDSLKKADIAMRGISTISAEQARVLLKSYQN